MRLITLIGLALLLALQLRLWVSNDGLPQLFRLDRQIAENKVLIASKQARNAELEAEVIDLKSGTSAIESRARETLGMIKPNESFFLVVTRKQDKK